MQHKLKRRLDRFYKRSEYEKEFKMYCRKYQFSSLKSPCFSRKASKLSSDSSLRQLISSQSQKSVRSQLHLFSIGRSGVDFQNQLVEVVHNRSIDAQTESPLLWNEPVLMQSPFQLVPAKQKLRQSLNVRLRNRLSQMEPKPLEVSLVDSSVCEENAINHRNFNNFYKYKRVREPLKFVKNKATRDVPSRIKRHKSVSVERSSGAELREQPAASRQERMEQSSQRERQLKQKHFESLRKRSVRVKSKKTVKAAKPQKQSPSKKRVDLNMKSESK